MAEKDAQEVPSGLSMNLEKFEKTMRSIEAEQLLDRFLRETITVNHRSDGWRARRRLQRELDARMEAHKEHFHTCRRCRDMAIELGQRLGSFVSSFEKTAP